MVKKFPLVAGLLGVLLLMQCKKERDTTFLISEEHIGKVNRNTLVSDLATVFASDSIVKDTLRQAFGDTAQKIKIYEKGGAHLLTLTPRTDSVSKIGNVQIFDPRFSTAKGIGLASTFKEIRDSYTIRKIVTSRNNVVLFIQDSDLYFTISKEELPASLRYTSNSNIEAVQIPDKARVKYLMMGWE